MSRGDPPKDYIDAVPFPPSVTLEPIGVVHSTYTERHGTPRQATVGDATEAVLVLDRKKVQDHALRHLDGFDKIWVISWMHLNQHWKPMVLPPRGPRVKRGILATRAPHRPNPIALSAVDVIAVEANRIRVRGHDLLNGTPILDIKPYIPYADAFPTAAAGWVDELDGRDPAQGPGRAMPDEWDLRPKS